jgi:hypothetical protein
MKKAKGLVIKKSSNPTPVRVNKTKRFIWLQSADAVVWPRLAPQILAQIRD